MGGWAAVGRLAFAALVAASAAAIWIQDRTGALPLGLFNAGRETYDLLSWVALACAAALLGLFALEIRRGRALAVAGVARAALASLLLLELLLTGIDLTLASRGDDPPLGGPYRELRSRFDGDWLFVKKPHAGSPLGFRSAEPAPLRAALPRVLFLGDSYTEGSGRAAACNYPEVAVAELGRSLGRPLAVLNAGVAGYGPVDAERLFGHLLATGHAFDAVVLSLFLENDFTDNLPATTRRVVAGINFRFPESAFLRAMHPLNSRSFRYALFAERAGRLVRGGGAPARRDSGECQLEAAPPAASPAELTRLVRRRLAASYGPEPRLATDVVTGALARFAQRAREAGVPAALVVFPDRVLADEDLARELGVDPTELPIERLRGPLAAAWPDAIDLTQVLRDVPSAYRRDDTHLSDRGNLHAGRAVGRRLAERWRGHLSAVP